MLNKPNVKDKKIHLTDRLTFGQGDMEKLTYEDNSFDVGLSAYIVYYDPSVAVKEFYHVVKPMGNRCCPPCRATKCNEKSG